MFKVKKYLDNLNVGAVAIGLLCVIACHDVVEMDKVNKLNGELRAKEEIITSLTEKNNEQFGIICNLKIEKSELECKIEEMQNE